MTQFEPSQCAAPYAWDQAQRLARTYLDLLLTGRGDAFTRAAVYRALTDLLPENDLYASPRPEGSRPDLDLCRVCERGYPCRDYLDALAADIVFALDLGGHEFDHEPALCFLVVEDLTSDDGPVDDLAARAWAWWQAEQRDRRAAGKEVGR